MRLNCLATCCVSISPSCHFRAIRSTISARYDDRDMNEQRLRELEELRQQAREIKLFRLSEEDGEFLRSLHFKPSDQLTREEEARLRTLVKSHWRREE